MQTPSPSIQGWAWRLLAAEAANQGFSEPPGHDVLRVTEKLRETLTEFVGPDGFTALLRRALALARREDFPLLQNAKVTADGRLEGITYALATADRDREAAIAIIASLLWLLVTFIGEPLMLRLVRGAFPNASDRKIVESEDFP